MKDSKGIGINLLIKLASGNTVNNIMGSIEKDLEAHSFIKSLLRHPDIQLSNTNDDELSKSEIKSQLAKHIQILFPSTVMHQLIGNVVGKGISGLISATGFNSKILNAYKPKTHNLNINGLDNLFTSPTNNQSTNSDEESEHKEKSDKRYDESKEHNKKEISLLTDLKRILEKSSNVSHNPLKNLVPDAGTGIGIANFITKHAGKVGGTIAALFAGYTSYEDYQDVQEKEKTGKLTKSDADKLKSKALFRGVNEAGGAWGGAEIGSWIGGGLGTLAAPGVGTAAGAAIGGGIGSYLGFEGGSKIGDYLGNQVYDSVMGNKNSMIETIENAFGKNSLFQSMNTKLLSVLNTFGPHSAGGVVADDLKGIADKAEKLKKDKSSVMGSILNTIDKGLSYFFSKPVDLSKSLLDSSVNLKNWSLGDTSKEEESGKKGAGNVSNIPGAIDGTSYGLFSLATSTGDAQKYVENSKYASQFEGLTPGTSAFDEKWKSIAKSDKDFGADQTDYIRRTKYQPMLTRIAAQGMDLSKRGAGVQDEIFSTAVQFGANSNVISNALSGLDVANMTDTEITNAIQDYKIKNNDKLFRSSSTSVRNSVLNRDKREKDKVAVLDQASAIPNNFNTSSNEKEVPKSVMVNEHKTISEQSGIMQQRPNISEVPNDIFSYGLLGFNLNPFAS